MKIKNIHLLIGLAACVLFFNINSWGVTETSEARYAEISWEIYQSGDYMHPTLLEIGHYHKPPATYWLTALAYHIFGPGVFAARFFLQIAVLVQILLVYQIGRLLFENNKTAFYAASIYFSFPAIVIGTRALTTDHYLTTAVLGAVYCWLKYRSKNKVPYLYLFYCLIGVGFLIKGPVVLIVPITVLIAYNYLKPLPGQNNKLHHLLGVTLCFVIGTSWFIMLYRENNAFIDYFIFDHTVDRFATNNFGRKKPFWFYLVIVPLTAFPWFFMLLKPLIATRKMKFNEIHFLLIWVFVPLIFFSLSTSKLVLYVLPIYAGIALLAGHIWNVANINRRVWLHIMLTFSFIVALGLLIAPLVDSNLYANVWMYLVPVGFILITIFLYLRTNQKAMRGLMIIQSLLFISCVTIYSTFFMKNNPVLVNDQRNVATYIKSLPNIERIYVYNERVPSLAFHLQRPIISINDGDKDLQRETQFEADSTWRDYLVTPQELSGRQLKNSVLVFETGDKTSEELRQSLKYFKHKEEIDGWEVYN